MILNIDQSGRSLKTGSAYNLIKKESSYRSKSKSNRESRSPKPRDFNQVPLISRGQLSQDFGSTP